MAARRTESTFPRRGKAAACTPQAQGGGGSAEVKYPDLVLRPWTIKKAIPFCERTHRRLPEIQGAMWAVSVREAGEIVGVALVGHPAPSWMGDYDTLTVLRVAVLEGYRNACSMLYGACSRAARAMGTDNLVTYTHLDEPGTSLRAAGWIDGGLTDGGEWSRDGRQRKLAIDSDSKRHWWAPWSQRAQEILGQRKEVA